MQIDDDRLEKIISALNNTQTSESGILKSALLIKEGKLDSAKGIVEHELTLTSDDAEIHYRRGVLCEMLELYEQARSEYSSALRLDSNNKDSAYALGLSYFRDGDMEKSIRYLQRTLEIDPEFAEAYYLLGTALESRGLSGVAKKAFTRAKELDPAYQKTAADNYKPESMLSYSGDGADCYFFA